MPKISVITVNYNNAEGLKSTIKSVLSQSLTEFEFIVVDGDSSDGSRAIIDEYKDHISQWLIKADSGVYQAMNRGIEMATGTYVLFLNSGDTFRDSQILWEANKKIVGNVEIYFGNLMFTHCGKEMLQEYPKELHFHYFLERSLPHPGSFIKKELFDKYFYYSEDYSIVSDWEFFIYAICKAEASYKHLEMVISNFDLQGMSNDPKNKAKITEEREKVLEKYFPSEYKELKERQSKKIQGERKLSAKVIRTLKRLFRSKVTN